MVKNDPPPTLGDVLRNGFDDIAEQHTPEALAGPAFPQSIKTKATRRGAMTVTLVYVVPLEFT